MVKKCARAKKRSEEETSQDVGKEVEKSVEESPAEHKDLDVLCDALSKADVKSEEECTKPISVVDDIEKEEYEKEQKEVDEEEKEQKEAEEEKEDLKFSVKSEKEDEVEKDDLKVSTAASEAKDEEEKFLEKILENADLKPDAKSEKSEQGEKEDLEPAVKLAPLVRPPTTKKDYKIPREWACYSKCGEVVPTTPFLPFKAPLSEERFRRHPELEEHTIFSLIQDLSSRGIRLRTVIDLTLPHFYEFEYLESFDIRYEKIRIDNQEPRWHQVKQFLEICDQFAVQQAQRKVEWEARQKERKERGEEEEYYMYEVIGVHCTRGVNRTGYMICRAMIERMNYTAEHAVRLFNQARGHDMTEFMPELKRAEEKKRFYERRNQYGRGRGGGTGGYSDRGGRGGGGERGRGSPRGGEQ